MYKRNLPGPWLIQQSSWRLWELHFRRRRSQWFQRIVLQFRCQKRPTNLKVDKRQKRSILDLLRYFHDIYTCKKTELSFR